MPSLVLSTNQLGFYHASLRSFLFARVILEDMIHLLESPAFGFRYKEVGPHCSENAKDGEENVGTVAGVLNERRCDETL
jgi:hypothetical protein